MQVNVASKLKRLNKVNKERLPVIGAKPPTTTSTILKRDSNTIRSIYRFYFIFRKSGARTLLLFDKF